MTLPFPTGLLLPTQAVVLSSFLSLSFLESQRQFFFLLTVFCVVTPSLSKFPKDVSLLQKPHQQTLQECQVIVLMSHENNRITTSHWQKILLTNLKSFAKVATP